MTLQVPAAWLTGEQQALPYVPEWNLVTRQGEGVPSLWERPTADAVRYSWLMQRIEAALRRDLGEWYGNEASHAFDSWGHGLLGVFSELASSIAWRTACLEPSSSGSWYELMKSDDSPSISWLTHVLEPWLTGSAYLNVDILRTVYEALLANPERVWGSKIRDADGLRGLEHYGTAVKEFTKAADRIRDEEMPNQ